MSEPTPDKPSPPGAKPRTPARPKRAAAPIAKPSAPTLASPGSLHVQRPSPRGPAGSMPSDALSELAAIAGSTITPSSVAPAPSASAISNLRHALPTITAVAAARQTASNRATLVPPSLTLGLTLPLLGIGWFALDRHRVLRDNPLGIGLPILLFAGGAIFLGLLAAILMQDTRRARRTVAPSSPQPSNQTLSNPSPPDAAS